MHGHIFHPGIRVGSPWPWRREWRTRYSTRPCTGGTGRRRPQEVLGQDHVVRALTGAIREGRLHHAFLFCGPRGTGKTSTARILAKMVNCEQGPTAEPCGVCSPVRRDP